MTMASTKMEQVAQFETSKRLLAQLVNEGLLHAYICLPKVSHKYGISLKSADTAKAATDVASVIVHVNLNAYLEVEGDRVLPMLRPEYLEEPIVLEQSNGESTIETEPGKIFRSLYTSVAPEWVEPIAAEKIAHELSTTSLNQCQYNHRVRSIAIADF